jgi:hypothetical protein
VGKRKDARALQREARVLVQQSRLALTTALITTDESAKADALALASKLAKEATGKSNEAAQRVAK